MDNKAQAIINLVETVRRLRAPGGCPWDRAQTHQTLRPYVIEEAYEVLDCIDNIHSTADLKNEAIRNPFREELGDLLMQVLIHSAIANEEGAFDFFDVAKGLDEKLIRRHPHVFGETKADSADSALANWEQQKAKEKEKKKDSSVLSGLPRSLPALQRTARVIERVTRVGFQWDDLQGPIDKIDEELKELKAEINTGNQKRVEAELGDLLFSLCNVAYLMKISPEDALRGTLSRFESRFRHVETRLREQGREPTDATLAEMDNYWNEAKTMERKKPRVFGLTGGIASGKSLAARFFTEEGITVIDADKISRELSQPGGKAHEAILQRFGTDDRKKLRELVFADAQARRDLEAILHPLIKTEALDKMKEGGLYIYEAALLVETGQHNNFDELIVINAPAEIRRDRLIRRDGITPELANQILAAQTSDEARKQAATILIENNGSEEELKQQVHQVAARLRAMK